MQPQSLLGHSPVAHHEGMNKELLALGVDKGTLMGRSHISTQQPRDTTLCLLLPCRTGPRGVTHHVHQCGAACCQHWLLRCCEQPALQGGYQTHTLSHSSTPQAAWGHCSTHGGELTPHGRAAAGESSWIQMLWGDGTHLQTAEQPAIADPALCAASIPPG